MNATSSKRMSYEELWNDMYISPFIDEYNATSDKITNIILQYFNIDSLKEYDISISGDANQCDITFGKDIYELKAVVSYSGIYLENLKDVDIECGVSSYNGYTSYNTIKAVTPHLDTIYSIIEYNINEICDYIDVLTRMNMNIQHCKMIYRTEVSKVIDMTLSYEDNVRTIKLLFINEYLN